MSGEDAILSCLVLFTIRRVGPWATDSGFVVEGRAAKRLLN